MKNETNEFSFRLQPSLIPDAGVGVFALHDIAVGTLLDLSDKDTSERILKKEQIPEGLIRYCIAQEDGTWICPMRFNQMSLTWYLNHSTAPNVFQDENGDVFSLRDIVTGEEITIDYDILNEPNELREDFYKK